MSDIGATNTPAEHSSTPSCGTTPIGEARWYDGAGSEWVYSEHDRSVPFATAFADGVLRETNRVETSRLYRRRLAARRAEAIAAGKPVATRRHNGPRVPRPDPLELERLRQNMRSIKALVALRWKGGDGPQTVLPPYTPAPLGEANPNPNYPPEAVRGFLLGGLVNGIRRQTVRIEGFRSRSSENLGLFCARLPRGRRMRVGNDKAILRKGGPYSCLSRDEPYVKMNTAFLSAFRVDLDAVFAGGLSDLHQKLVATGLPWLPNLVVYDEGPGGTVRRPHLYFQLPHDGAVWNVDDPRCRKSPRSLFRAIHRGLTELLMPVGADPGGLSNPHHGKNPLCEHWHVAEMETIHPTMSMWAGARRCDGSRVLKLGASVDHMLRAKAAAEASRIGQDPAWSNTLFSEIRRACQSQVSSWQADRDPRYSIDDRERLAESLELAMERHCRNTADPEHAAYILKEVASWVARIWDPQRRSKIVARGRDAHLVDVGMLMEERQAVAGSATRAAVALANLKKLTDALRAIPGGPTSAVKAQIAKVAGISLRTVHRRWAEAIAVMQDDEEGSESGLSAEIAEDPLCFLSIQHVARSIAAGYGVASDHVEIEADKDRSSHVLMQQTRRCALYDGIADAPTRDSYSPIPPTVPGAGVQSQAEERSRNFILRHWCKGVPMNGQRC